MNNLNRIASRIRLRFFSFLGTVIGKVLSSAGKDENLYAIFLSRVLAASARSDDANAFVRTTSFGSAQIAHAWEPFLGREPIGETINFAALWRNEWIAQKARGISTGAKVLDAGAGECQYRELFRHTEYKTQDFSQYVGTTDGPQKENWRYGQIDYVSDIVAIPVPDDSFDVVLCTEVLEHVPEPIATLRELGRVLKPGGCLILTAPLGSGLHQEPYHYYGGFTPHFYRTQLTALGLHVEEITPIGGLLRNVAQECHRVGRVIEGNSVREERERSLLDLLTNWLPRILSSLDQKYFVEQFTVGYLVMARKAQPEFIAVDKKDIR